MRCDALHPVAGKPGPTHSSALEATPFGTLALGLYLVSVRPRSQFEIWAEAEMIGAERLLSLTTIVTTDTVEVPRVPTVRVGTAPIGYLLGRSPTITVIRKSFSSHLPEPIGCVLFPDVASLHEQQIVNARYRNVSWYHQSKSSNLPDALRLSVLTR
jgi:hypothetical protein